MSRTLAVTARLRVEFEVNDEDAITRVTGPGGDEWRSHFYKLFTLEDVLEHWTYNVVNNGVRNLASLAGWGDLGNGAVKVNTEYEAADFEGWERD